MEKATYVKPAQLCNMVGCAVDRHQGSSHVATVSFPFSQAAALRRGGDASWTQENYQKIQKNTQKIHTHAKKMQKKRVGGL